jgi:multidrug efflux pump subunit AcrA (membrane-fusion protein)
MMQLKQLSSVICTLWFVLLLSGCGAKPDAGAATWDTRPILYIGTQLIGTSDSKGSITKNAKVLWVSDIMITSQVAGRVTSIPVQLGQAVWPNSSLVRLADTNGTISFGLQKNKLAVDSANNSYAIQKANLEKQIEDAQLALRRAQLTADTTRDDTAKQLEKLDYDLASVNPLLSGSNTQIQLENLKKQLEKAEYDYQTKLTSDTQTLTSFVTTADNLYSDVSNLVADVVTESDKFLWISNEFKHINDGYEVYISARDSNKKDEAELSLDRLISLQDDLEDLGKVQITQENIVSYIQSYSAILDAIKTLNEDMKDVLIATVPSQNLPQWAIDGLMASYNGLISRSSGIIASSTSQINAINSFTSVYQQNQNSITQQIDLLKNQIALTEKSLNDAQFNTQLGSDRTKLALANQLTQTDINLESTKLTTDFVTNTKDLNLDSIQNQLRSAQVALSELNFNAAKFNVSSPIRGVVSDILVDVWQDVNPWTPIARVVSNQQELEITLTESEKKFIKKGQKVMVSNQNQSTFGTVTSVSTTADRNGNFVVKISIDDAMFDVGVFVDVKIELQAGNSVVPVNAVTIVDINRGQIALWDGSKLINKTVWLGSIFGEMIEITDALEPGLMLVTSDITNYDPNKQKIELRKRVWWDAAKVPERSDKESEK